MRWDWFMGYTCSSPNTCYVNIPRIERARTPISCAKCSLWPIALKPINHGQMTHRTTWDRSLAPPKCTHNTFLMSSEIKKNLSLRQLLCHHQIIQLNRIFHLNPGILRYPGLRNPSSLEKFLSKGRAGHRVVLAEVLHGQLEGWKPWCICLNYLHIW